MEKKKIYRNLVILGVTVGFMLIVTLIIQFVMIGIESKKQANYENEVAKLQAAAKDLESDIEYKKTVQYIEKYAREELDLYGENEVIFVPEN